MPAKRDGNRVPTMLGALNTDGQTTVNVLVDSVTHGLNISDATTGSDHGQSADISDENRVPAFLAVSSADGVTPVVVYADASGNLLVKST